MFGQGEKYDLKSVPFSRANSSIAIYEEAASNTLFLTFNRVSPWLTLQRRALIKIEPSFESRPIDYTYHATPSKLELDTNKGTIEMCIEENNVLRIRGKDGASLRLVVEPEYNECLCAADFGGVDVNLGLHGRMLIAPIIGTAEGYAPWNDPADKPCYMVLDLMPDRTGTLEVAIHCAMREVNRLDSYAPFDRVLAKVERDFDNFCSKYPAVEEKYAETAKYAMYTVWSHQMGPSESSVVRAPLVQLNKLLLCHGFAWQQSYNAMAMTEDPYSALEFLTNMFSYQLKSGMLPDWVDYYTVNYLSCKPGIQGFALLYLLKHSDIASVLNADMCEKLYVPFTRWTNFWLEHRAADREGVVRYFHVDESGWDGSTIFSEGLPVEAPDLMAFVISLMDACAWLARGCKRFEEAVMWEEKSNKMLNILIDEFWDGKLFVAKNPRTGKAVSSRSIACLQPIILGKKLPGHIIDTIAETLMSSEYFTDIGLVSEPITGGASMSAGSYMSGQVIAPLQMLMSAGLLEAGKTEEAKRICRAFCDKMNDSGVFLGFASDGSEATGDYLPWASWGAACFLAMAGTILAAQ